MKTWISLATLLATSSVYAAEVVTLADGRQVKLNDDFTWEYLVNAAAEKSVNTSENQAPELVAAPLITAIPLVNKLTGTTIVVNANKPAMQLSDSGVDILIGPARYQQGELLLPTSVTNQSSQSVILVTLEVQVLDMSGKELATETVNVWQSIKRLADTYLRPQQAEQGNSIKLALPESPQYQLVAKIVEVKTR
ncbi:DUF3157 family protein [Vibrio sp. CAU 1672]|uniref:DUF3157 family protein n=1 Tax=Vibrio sp. CAU 1672 TaxID=3032594 RepID=UPI0023DADC16|nr:DUF3157 family protein [Vibrio sp. CAU 1672]MDF2155099.1 DUF3157 family protein [Vibrio sp. CAU 1672]